MGLNIAAYGNIRLLKPDEAPPRGVRTIRPYRHPLYPASRFEGLVDHGVYAVDPEKTFGFRAGSYSSYQEWLAHLCHAVYGVGVGLGAIRSFPRYWPDDPFVELIRFSDECGALGPRVCAKLAGDFAAYQDRAEEWDAHSLGFLRDYTNWRTACELAAQNGCIEFQ